jgi:hypothetical protein
LLFSFVESWISLPRGCAGFCSQGWLREFYMVHGAYLFILSNDEQAGLELAVVLAVVVVVAAAVRNGSKFPQCNVAFPGIEVQGVEDLLLAGALFLLDGGRRWEGKKKEKKKKKKAKKKKITVGKEGFLRARPTYWLCSRSQLLGAIKG